MEKLRYNFNGTLSDKEIIKIVDDYKKSDGAAAEVRIQYAKGNNPAILQRLVPSGAPDNKIPVSYARRMINIITSYMYKPGSVQYASENQPYLDKLLEIFDANKEDLETEQIGRQTSIHGVGYEMFYIEGVGKTETLIDKKPGYTGTIPRFTKIPVDSTIAIYNFDIIPQLIAFIRFYTIEQEETEHIWVYYEKEFVEYLRKANAQGLPIGQQGLHGFDRVPLVVYENNEDLIGDFSCVLPLIDAYDVLMSDSLNEFDRFAWAYLIMRGFSLSKDDAEQIKHKRAFALLGEKDTVEFLTKEINHEFIQFMSEWIRDEIHKQSGIPNLEDFKFGASVSGETLSKFIYMMELFTDPKESYFMNGLKQRLEIVSVYANLGDPTDIEITMNRNVPDKSMEQAELMEKYAGHISEKTLIEQFADFVDDAEAEMEQLKAEKEESLDTMVARMEKTAAENPPPQDNQQVDEAGNEVPKENP